MRIMSSTHEKTQQGGLAFAMGKVRLGHVCFIVGTCSGWPHQSGDLVVLYNTTYIGEQLLLVCFQEEI